MRRSAGGPGYRELARHAHYSPTTLAQAARGVSFPSLPVTLAYVRACGGDVSEWEERWRATAAELHPPLGDVRESAERGPYVGLAAYGPDDAEWFRGREQLVATLVDRVARQRFVAVVGASGAGKSSVLRAGLLPAMAAKNDRTSTLVVTPGAHPLQECAIRLSTRLGTTAGRLAAEFAEGPQHLGLAVRQLVANRPDGADFLLIVDQFEELFTLCQDSHERDRFIDALLDAAESPDNRVRVVVGLRADFYAHCARHARLVAALQDAQVLIGPMSTDELVEAITQPAARAGLMVEKALVVRVVNDAAERPGALPFVSHALWETWRRRHGNGLFLAGYTAAGGLDGAVAQTADRVYDDLDERKQGIAREILLRLTALGEGTEDTGRRVSHEELLDSPDRDAIVAVLSRLAAARLVTVGADTVEVAHEALIRSWPTLRSWLAEDRETVLAHRRLTEAAAEWTRHDHDDSLLYRGARLAGWRDRSPDRLNDAERAFLAASIGAESREHRLRRRRIRWTIGGLGTTTAAVIVLAVIALLMAGRAEDERALAQNRQLIADARAQLQVDPELALLLAREAFTQSPNENTEAMLRQAAADSRLRTTLPAHPRDSIEYQDSVTGVVFTPDGKHLLTSNAFGLFQLWDWNGGRVAPSPSRVLRGPYDYPRSLALSPDGDHFAVATPNGVLSARGWAGGARPAYVRGRGDDLWCVVFSPDGQRMASGGEDGTVRVWEVAGGAPSQVFPGHDGGVYGVAFSPDGRLLASGGEDGTLRIWDLAGGGSPLVLQGQESEFLDVAFSPDGGHIATAGAEGAIEVWDPAGRTSVVLGNHDNVAQTVAYSADGHSIVSGGNDGTVRIWNADRRGAPVVLRGHRNGVAAAVFSPDGKAVVSAGGDGTAKVWDVDEVEQSTVLRGHDGMAGRAAPSPDGRRVASGGRDGTVRLWDTNGNGVPTVLTGTGRIIDQVAFGPGGRHLVAVDEAGAVLVWDTEELRLRSSDLGVESVTVSPDGTRLAVATSDSTVSVWDISAIGSADPSATLQLPSGSHGQLYDVAWSVDGRHIAAASDESVVMWDLLTRAEPAVFSGHRGQVWTLTFSQDGTRLAAAGDSDSIHLWDVDNPTRPTVLRGQQGRVSSMTFSEDGRHLVTASSSAAVRIWKADGAAEPLVLDGFGSSVQSVAALGEDRFVTAHGDGSVRIWRCPACGPIANVLADSRGHTTRQLTEDERRIFGLARR
ncbi:WD40 repeat domain-containing protein [Actinophytocola sp.]|uniref:WD40 repeat domain-containing protein n=1 Tax=Actinophytocola sp. TaxID=1872138 RepID=UPI002ED0C972